MQACPTRPEVFQVLYLKYTSSVTDSKILRASIQKGFVTVDPIVDLLDVI